MHSFGRIRIALTALAVLAASVFVSPAAVSAQGVFDVCGQNGAGSSVVCRATGTNNISGPQGIIIKVANIFAFVTGIAAVFVIMYGGFALITADGDSSKSKTGRDALTYAVVGLVIIVLSRAIIGFVVTRF